MRTAFMHLLRPMRRGQPTGGCPPWLDLVCAAHRMRDEGLYAPTCGLRDIQFAVVRWMWRQDVADGLWRDGTWSWHEWRAFHGISAHGDRREAAA